ncbi:hypothetical protein FRB94_003528 [Tulasnella sp. JGI-2019a]|nr:hypothetical protein FRB94_003528 [Tulasnella sp. JGI-2019a]
MDGNRPPTAPPRAIPAQFSGQNGENVQQLVQEAQRARACAVIQNNNEFEDVWLSCYIRTRLADPALAWFDGLDDNIRGNWVLLRRALILKYGVPPPPFEAPEAPAAAAMPWSREPTAVDIAEGAEESMNALVPPVRPGSASIGELMLKPCLLAISNWTIDMRMGRIRVVDAFDGRELGFVTRSVTGPLTMEVGDALEVQLHPLSLALTQRHQRITMLNATLAENFIYLGLMQRPSLGDRSWCIDPCVHGGSSAVYRGRATSYSGGRKALAASKIWTIHAIGRRDPGKELRITWPEDDGERTTLYTFYTMENSNPYIGQKIVSRLRAGESWAKLIFDPLRG